ncbi:MAG: hemerythrin domain-containing protein [Candidatus Scalindua sp.]|nr:hemerythrin domain-containing protein [Candidatus Scalindua sp.]
MIEEFKREHSEIVAALNRVKELGIQSRDGRAELSSVKAILLEHLENEDERLYPFLRKEAEKKKELKNILDLFALEMEDVTKAVTEFFHRFSRGEILDEKLEEEFENIAAALVKRIKNEESILYDEYEYINQ